MPGLLVALLVACSAPSHREVTAYYFREGGTMTCKVDGRVTLHLEVRGGNLLLNGVNTGPFGSGAPVQFISETELLVHGVRREIP